MLESLKIGRTLAHCAPPVPTYMIRTATFSMGFGIPEISINVILMVLVHQQGKINLFFSIPRTARLLSGERMRRKVENGYHIFYKNLTMLYGMLVGR